MNLHEIGLMNQAPITMNRVNTFDFKFYLCYFSLFRRKAGRNESPVIKGGLDKSSPCDINWWV